MICYTKKIDLFYLLCCKNNSNRCNLMFYYDDIRMCNIDIFNNIKHIYPKLEPYSVRFPLWKGHNRCIHYNHLKQLNNIMKVLAKL